MAVRITRAGVGLTVGIIVLALVVLGGLYLAKERGEQARRADSIEVAQQNLYAQSGTDTITPSVDGNTEESGTKNEESTESTNDSEASTNQEGTATEESTTEQSPNELPQTGASETAAIIAVALLTFASVSYIASRRALTQNR